MSLPNGLPNKASTELGPLRMAPSMLAAPEPPPPPPPNSYRWIHQALRGRYVLAIVLASICGSVGGWFGWRSQIVWYRSEGLIEIEYAKPAVMKPTDVTTEMPNFQARLQSQRLFIKSLETIQAALQQPEWQATGRGSSTDVIKQFEGNLDVENPKDAVTLRISFKDPEPAVAAAAVRSIIHAYADFYRERENKAEQQRMGELASKVADLTREIGTLTEQKRVATKEFGASPLEMIYANAMQRFVDRDLRLNNIKEALAMKRHLAPTQAATDRRRTALTPEQIARIDTGMRDLLTDVRRREAEVEALRVRGLLDGHREMISARSALEQAVARVQQAVQDYQQSVLTSGPAREGKQDDPIDLRALPVEVLEENLTAMEKLYDEAHRDMLSKGELLEEVKGLQALIDEDQKSKKEYAKRIEDLKVETSGAGGRLLIDSEGEVPVSPSLDNRRRMAGVGAVGGAGLPVGLLLVWGLLRNRFRYADETQGDVPLLGILPRLSDSMKDVDCAGAAHSVHRIRAMLQMGHSGDGPMMYLVTSAAAGEGKTSLTAALALSFAASGSRTLLIDCDSVGQHLSSRFKARRLPGLREALVAGGLTGCIKQFDERLSILPIGIAGARDISTTSPLAIRRLLNEAGTLFDVVLVDTGPVLGGVEPVLVAPEVDGVILTVARGQRRSAVDAAMQHLRSMGARIAGLVFNFAERRDFQQSYSVSAERLPAVVEGGSHDPQEDFDLGPLVNAAVAATPEQPPPAP